MKTKLLFTVIALVLFTEAKPQAKPVAAEEMICGRWESSQKNLIIQVYMDGDKYLAKIVWFSNTEGKPLDYWTDVNNPNPALRSRKLVGMNVLNSLTYDANTRTWEDGMIYDSIHGREWNASASIDKKGMLKVKGYWHFKFIGKTMTFVRVS